MANEQDLVRVRMGAMEWNRWAEEQIKNNHVPQIDLSGVAFDHRMSFSEFIFPGPVSFRGARFAHARFDGARFLGVADFTAVSIGTATDKVFSTFDRVTFSWRAEFSGAKFADTTTFSDVTFQRDAMFSKASFSSARFLRAEFLGFVQFADATWDDIWFADCKFNHHTFFDGIVSKGWTTFRGSTFLGNAHFTRATFHGSVTFEGAQMGSAVDFTGARFAGMRTNFIGARFDRVPAIQNTSFVAPADLAGMTIAYGGEGILRRAQPVDAANFRRLKQLAAEVKDHERELAFFASELRAKRFHETKGFWPITLNVAYDWLADYGRSIARPFAWLVGLVVIATACIAVATSAKGIGAALVLATTNSALLVGSDKWLLRQAAFSELGYKVNHFGLIGEALAYGQSALSLFLFFLIGLGLRNRFRIGGGGG